MGEFRIKEEPEDLLQDSEPQRLSGFSKDDYMASVNGPLRSDSLQVLLDYKDESIIREYANFDAEKAIESLTATAASAKIPPDVFIREMKFIVSQRNKELADLPRSLRHLRSFQDNRLWGLRKKYNLESFTCSGFPMFSPIRLSILFPHFCDIHQVPLYSMEFSPDRILFMCQHPEFGGLIPTLPNKELSYKVRKAIIGVHLYSVSHSNGEFPLRTYCVLLEHRRLKSQLSNERRLLFLENNNIITKRKTLTPTMEAAMEQIDLDDFEKEIPWELLKI